MTSYLYRTRGMLQFPRYLPTMIARVQASQSSSTTSNQVGNQPIVSTVNYFFFRVVNKVVHLFYRKVQPQRITQIR